METEEENSFKSTIIGSLILAFVILIISAVTILFYSEEFSLFPSEGSGAQGISGISSSSGASQGMELFQNSQNSQNLQDLSQGDQANQADQTDQAEQVGKLQEIVFYKTEEEFFLAHPKRFKSLLNADEEDDAPEKKMISVTEAAFDLYHSPKSRLAVEWFYTDITKNRNVALAILRNADEFHIPFPLAFSLAYAESKYKPRAYHVNTNGTVDRGLFQLNSSSFPDLTEAQFFDADTSAHYGLNHLNYCIKLGGNIIAGLAMYNAGQGKVKGSGTPFSTINYINSIVSRSDVIEQNFTLEVMSYYTNTLSYDGSFNGK